MNLLSPEQRCNEVGERLKMERQRLKMSQKAFAKASGVSRNSQYLYENSVGKPNADYLIAVAALGADINFILGQIQSPISGTAIHLDMDYNIQALKEIYILGSTNHIDQMDKIVDEHSKLCLFASVFGGGWGCLPESRGTPVPEMAKKFA